MPLCRPPGEGTRHSWERKRRPPRPRGPPESGDRVRRPRSSPHASRESRAHTHALQHVIIGLDLRLNLILAPYQFLDVPDSHRDGLRRASVRPRLLLGHHRPPRETLDVGFPGCGRHRKLRLRCHAWAKTPQPTASARRSERCVLAMGGVAGSHTLLEPAVLW